MMRMSGSPMAALALGVMIAAGTAAHADDVVTGWSAVVPPPAPKVEAVKLDPATTAVLMLDFNTPACNPTTKARCIATVPLARSVLDKARAHGVFVVYTLAGNNDRTTIEPRLTPLANDPVLPALPDKFLNPALEQALKDKGIKTVITMGSVSNGAILYTASSAAFRGFNVVVPVDGVSADTSYAEQLTLWQLVNGPRLGDKVKLTRGALIDF